MKFSITDIFSKSDQILSHISDGIRNGKLLFLPSVWLLFKLDPESSKLNFYQKRTRDPVKHTAQKMKFSTADLVIFAIFCENN